MAYLRMNCADKGHQNETNPSRRPIMLEDLNSRAKYANEINWIGARFESKFTESKKKTFGCESKWVSFLNPGVTQIWQTFLTDKHSFAEFSLFIFISAIWKVLRCQDAGTFPKMAITLLNEGSACIQPPEATNEGRGLETYSKVKKSVSISCAVLFPWLPFPSSADWYEMISLSIEGTVSHPCLLSLFITLVL